MTDLMTGIDDSLAQKDPALCNRAITLSHYDLSLALAEILGEGSGANFHSWAVWGSKKAGVTIRQEDLHQARDDAMRAGGASGLAVGVGVARYLSGRSGRDFWYGVGSVVGPVVGAKTAELMAIWSRKKAAKLVLQGNKLVLNDIGRVTAQFCHEFRDPKHRTELAMKKFVDQIETSLLRQAFECYGKAALSSVLRDKHEAAYFGNCLAILYEHQKLQPYIKGAMPLVVRRCVTKRLLNFEIGSLSLAVSQNVPHLGCHPFPPTLLELRSKALQTFLQEWDRATDSLSDSAAGDWTRLDHRMAYIVDLFRRFHCDPQVVSAPYSDT